MTTAVDAPRTSATGGAEPSTAIAGGGITVDEIVAAVVARRRLVSICTAAGLLLAVLIGVFGPRPYTARASFMPETSQQSAAASLASQLGLTASGPGQSLGFYAYLLLTRENLMDVIRHTYTFEAGGRSYSGNLVELLEVEGETAEGRLRGALSRLERAITVEVDSRAGLVRFSVEAPWDPLAEQIARRLLDGVHAFNLDRRRSQAAAESEFVGVRLEEAKRELRAAEDALARFLDRNRRFDNAPDLLFDYERLQREVQLKQRVHARLAEAYEQARIERVRNTPVITIVESPEGSARRSGRRLPLKMVIGVMLGGMVGVFLALIQGPLRRAAAVWRSLARDGRPSQEAR